MKRSLDDVVGDAFDTGCALIGVAIAFAVVAFVVVGIVHATGLDKWIALAFVVIAVFGFVGYMRNPS